MKALLKKYWWVVAIVLVVVVGYLYAGRKVTPPKEYKAEQKELENTNQVLLRQQEIILKSMQLQDRMITIYEANTKALLDVIDKNNRTIEQNKKVTNEEVTRVRNFNSSDITGFYSDLERQHDMHP